VVPRLAVALKEKPKGRVKPGTECKGDRSSRGGNQPLLFWLGERGGSVKEFKGNRQRIKVYQPRPEKAKKKKSKTAPIGDKRGGGGGGPVIRICERKGTSNGVSVVYQPVRKKKPERPATKTSKQPEKTGSKKCGNRRRGKKKRETRQCNGELRKKPTSARRKKKMPGCHQKRSRGGPKKKKQIRKEELPNLQKRRRKRKENDGGGFKKNHQGVRRVTGSLKRTRPSGQGGRWYREKQTLANANKSNKPEFPPKPPERGKKVRGRIEERRHIHPLGVRVSGGGKNGKRGKERKDIIQSFTELARR